ncbi:nucleotidyltransferase, partial [Hungatella sp. SL.1.14]|nr:nucleotidyltransferase [Hungatella sp. SL.1.14]
MSDTETITELPKSTRPHLTQPHITQQLPSQELLIQPQYSFLKTDPHLGKHIILLGLAGSYSYGTNNE